MFIILIPHFILRLKHNSIIDDPKNNSRKRLNKLINIYNNYLNNYLSFKLWVNVEGLKIVHPNPRRQQDPEERDVLRIVKTFPEMKGNEEKQHRN